MESDFFEEFRYVWGNRNGCDKPDTPAYVYHWRELFVLVNINSYFINL